MHQDIATPPVGQRLGEVPGALVRVLHTVKQAHVVSPRDLCNGVLHKLLVGVDLGQRAHVVQAAPREALHGGERVAQVVGEPVDHLGPPPMLSLTRQDLPADLPVQRDQLAVHGERGSHLRVRDAPRQLTQQRLVSRRRHIPVSCHHVPSPSLTRP